jgi:hypothetical protein
MTLHWHNNKNPQVRAKTTIAFPCSRAFAQACSAPLTRSLQRKAFWLALGHLVQHFHSPQTPSFCYSAEIIYDIFIIYMQFVGRLG